MSAPREQKDIMGWRLKVKSSSKSYELAFPNWIDIWKIKKNYSNMPKFQQKETKTRTLCRGFIVMFTIMAST